MFDFIVEFILIFQPIYQKMEWSRRAEESGLERCLHSFHHKNHHQCTQQSIFPQLGRPLAHTKQLSIGQCVNVYGIQKSTASKMEWMPKYTDWSGNCRKKGIRKKSLSKSTNANRISKLKILLIQCECVLLLLVTLENDHFISFHFICFALRARVSWSVNINTHLVVACVQCTTHFSFSSQNTSPAFCTIHATRYRLKKRTILIYACRR